MSAIAATEVATIQAAAPSMWGLTPEVVLLVVVAAQVVFVVAQVRAQLQQTRLAFLEKRVALYEAARAFARRAAEIKELEEIYGWERSVESFNKVVEEFRNFYPAYAHMFDTDTRALLREMVDDCWLLRGQLGDVREDDEPRQLSPEERREVEKALIETKLERLTKLAGRHFRVSRFLG